MRDSEGGKGDDSKLPRRPGSQTPKSASSLSPTQVATWVGSKPRILVINRADSVQALDRRLWTAHFKEVVSDAWENEA